jgi:hypothetical protein
MTTLTLQNDLEKEKQKTYWENWSKLAKGGMR